MDTHKFEVRQIATRIRSLHSEGRPFHIYHGTTFSTHQTSPPGIVINTTHLDNILDIDTNTNTASGFATVEPNVTMDRLVKETLKHGLVPPVVPQFPSLTVGGCFAGTAASCSSFRYGFFDGAVTWVEVVLGDGQITRADLTRNADLLAALPGSLGTLGVVTLLQIRLVPATQYVELSYIPVNTTSEALETMSTLTQDPSTDFVEALIYGPDASSYGVVAFAKMKNKGDAHPLVKFGRATDDWYYQHALTSGQSHKPEIVPITDYLFRHDRGTFCLGHYCFSRNVIPLNKWTRWLTDSATRSGPLMEIAKQLQWTDRFIMQDVVIPIQNAETMIKNVTEDLDVFPLLLYPILRWAEEHSIMRPNPLSSTLPSTHSSTLPSTLSINISIRGPLPTPSTPQDLHTHHRSIERAVQNLGGFKHLYSRNCYSESAFWSVYDEVGYDAVRKKYSAEGLESVFLKCGGGGGEGPEGWELGRKKKKKKKSLGVWARVFAWTGV